MTTVLALSTLALLSWLVPAHWRVLAWLVISMGALYALQDVVQPAGPDFATLTLIVIFGVWWLVRRASPLNEKDEKLSREDRIAIGAAIGMMLAAGLLRGAVLTLTLGVGLVALSGSMFNILLPTADDHDGRRRLALLWIVALIGALGVLKTPALSDQLRLTLSAPNWNFPPLSWFGFSYIAFRLLHVLIDYRNGRLPALSLRDFALYVVFFPTLSAGPIDRVQHFASMLTTAADKHFELRYVWAGGQRILWGLFRKFVLADSLANLALSPRLIQAAPLHPLGTWLMLYAYAFYIFLDFSGYTDIAIGIGLLIGITLPENFRRPYSRRNIALFWNSWHITLSNWYREYVFIPASRALLKARWHPLLAAFAVQLGTMILIGLWHGVSWNFIAWGAWHGVGLYAHRQLVTRAASIAPAPPGSPRAYAAQAGSVIVTFHFVALGWVFFALPDLHSSLKVFAALFGIAR